MARNYKRLIRVFEDNPSYALRVRDYVRDAGFGAAWLTHVEAIGSSDPVAGMRLARIGVGLTVRLDRLGPRWGDRKAALCLRAHALGLVANGHLSVQTPHFAEKYLARAFKIAKDCPCCLPRLNRIESYLKYQQGRTDEAFKSVNAAIKLSSSDLEIGRAFHMRGVLFSYTNRSGDALSDFQKVLTRISPEDRFFPVARYSYAFELTKSCDPGHLDDASYLIPEIEELFRGLRDLSVERAHFDWLKGGVYARQADIKPNLLESEKRALRKEARRLLRIARQKFIKLQLHEEATAVATDLAALKARQDRYSVSTILKGLLSPLDLRPLVKEVLRTIADRESTDAFWNALKALRDATVEMGCTPPLVSYEPGI